MTSVNDKYEVRTLLQELGETVIGAILLQIVFDTAAMDFYAVPGLCMALDEVDLSPQFLPYCVCSTLRSVS